MNNTNRIYKKRRKPSNFFCQTGRLENDEKYNPDIHLVGQNPRERCLEFYNRSQINRMNDVIRIREPPQSMEDIISIDNYIRAILSKPIIKKENGRRTNTFIDPLKIDEIVFQIIEQIRTNNFTRERSDSNATTTTDDDSGSDSDSGYMSGSYDSDTSIGSMGSMGGKKKTRHNKRRNKRKTYRKK